MRLPPDTQHVSVWLVCCLSVRYTSRCIHCCHYVTHWQSCETHESLYVFRLLPLNRIKALWNWMILVYTFLYCIIFQGFNENSVDLKTQTHNRATQHKVFIVIHTHIVFHLSFYVFALCLCELLSTLCIVLYSCICVCIFSFQVALTCWAHPMVHPKKTSQSLIACALPPLSPLVLTLSLSL